jgi:dihydrofolate reductase
MKIIGIAAVAENGIIGKDGNLPWYLPNDLKHFKEMTQGHWVVMGYMTYKHLGKPFPSRVNVIVTEQPLDDDRIIQAASVEDALEMAFFGGAQKVFISGGAWTYKKAESYIVEWDLTIVHANIEGDTSFPIDINKLKMISNQDYPADDKHLHPYSFRIYEPESID